MKLLKCIITGFLFLQISAQAESFDCTKSASSADKIACGNATIFRLDRGSNSAYKLALQDKSEMKTIVQAQQHSEDSNKPASAEDGLCEFLNETKNRKELTDPSEKLSLEELKTLKATSVIEFIDTTMGSWGEGSNIVDIDNDGTDDLIAWIIQGTGRIVNISAFNLPAPNDKKQITEQFYMDGGTESEPSFLRYRNKNYLASEGQYDNVASGMVISEIVKKDGEHHQIVRCLTETVVKAQSNCSHSACKALIAKVQKNNNKEFTTEIQSGIKELGLSVFASEAPIEIDYDNSGQRRYIWKIENHDLYPDMYWSWMGEGTKSIPPDVPKNNGVVAEDGQLLPGAKHDNLRKVLAQQKALLHKELIPGGDFFFLSDQSLNYWVWQISEDQKRTNELHVFLTKPKRSIYIGSIKLIRDELLKPCETKCDHKL